MAQVQRGQQLVEARQLVQKAKQCYLAGDAIASRQLKRQAGAIAQAVVIELLRTPLRANSQSLALVADSLASAKLLQAMNDHSLARRLLRRVSELVPHDAQVKQQLALCTYKDEELPPESRFADALAILDTLGLNDPRRGDPETLGQGGAVHKRRWERTGRIEDLHAALYFYRKGWQSNPANDLGYCGVNAAYLLDVLGFRARASAHLESAGEGYAEELARQSRELRRDMLERVPRFAEAEPGTTQRYWYLATMAEICFGLQEWSASHGWLEQAHQAEHDEWERQTTAKQLISIARMMGLQPPQAPEVATWEPPWQALHALLREDTFAAFESQRGKVGLALSGGGFRASLFHLGVMARLAECDILRSVEVLSTVSGGSIVGAHYYLVLRKWLRGKTDAGLVRDDYVAMVDEVIAQFLSGVQRNLRVRAFTNLVANLKMLVGWFGYGRSNRIGELYEKHLYAAVDDGMIRPRRMSDLLIHPLVRLSPQGDEYEEDFKPKFSNWRRRAKVPILVLNSTSLNSGHNWQFTASWMGEPPGLLGQEVDMNERYRRLYYRQAPSPKLRDYPLGYAVAASAGVPALFDPLVLNRLYPGRTVRLVDGGVHDNQGIAGLLDEGCNLLFCSDASGQMDDQDSPAAHELAVFLRTSSILQDRLREAQFQDLAWRVQTAALHGLFFVHLKQELESDPIDWIDCDDPAAPSARPSRTSYGVDRTIQKRLSAMRTDLDTFTDVEAYALMASGYLMAEHQLKALDRAHKVAGRAGSWGDFDVHAPRREGWAFEKILPIVAADPAGSDRRARDLDLQLEYSQRLFGKVWFLVPALKGAAVLAVAVALIAAVLWIEANWDHTFWLSYGLHVGTVVGAIVFLMIGVVLPFGRHVRSIANVRKWLMILLVATVGWVLSNLHLWVFDPLFRRRGKLERLLKLE